MVMGDEKQADVVALLSALNEHLETQARRGGNIFLLTEDVRRLLGVVRQQEERLRALEAAPRLVRAHAATVGRGDVYTIGIYSNPKKAQEELDAAVKKHRLSQRFAPKVSIVLLAVDSTTMRLVALGDKIQIDKTHPTVHTPDDE